MALIVVTIVAAFTLGRAQASSSTEAGPLDSASLTFLGVRAGGHETLADVKSRLGATEIWETGDASTSTSQICYRVPVTNGSVIILFGSSGEAAEPSGQVNHIVVYGDPRAFPYPKKRCGTLSRPPGPLRTVNGLRLGISMSEARRILGPRQLQNDQSLRYTTSQRRNLEPSDPRYSQWAAQKECFEDSSRPYFQDFASVTIKFKAGEAIFLGLSSNQSWCLNGRGDR